VTGLFQAHRPLDLEHVPRVEQAADLHPARGGVPAIGEERLARGAGMALTSASMSVVYAVSFTTWLLSAPKRCRIFASAP